MSKEWSDLLDEKSDERDGEKDLSQWKNRGDESGEQRDEPTKFLLLLRCPEIALDSSDHSLLTGFDQGIELCHKSIERTEHLLIVQKNLLGRHGLTHIIVQRE